MTLFSWISERKTNDFIRMKENEIIEYFNILISDQLKAMVPNRKFGSIFSGGIDSFLQTALLTKIHKPNKIITLNHVGKDKITENINLFQKFIQNKINVIHINKKKYLNDLKKSYEITKFPFLVHDFVGKYQLSKFFKDNGCKVFFAGDGADELFGGYQAYSKINWGSKEVENISPYSSFKPEKFNKKTGDAK